MQEGRLPSGVASAQKIELTLLDRNDEMECSYYRVANQHRTSTPTDSGRGGLEGAGKDMTHKNLVGTVDSVTVNLPRNLIHVFGLPRVKPKLIMAF